MPKKQRKIIVLTIMSIALILAALGGLAIYCTACLKTKEVPVAKYTLKNRTLISENEIEMIKVPSVYLNDEVCINKDDVLNKYVKLNTSIPKGSFIYNDAIDSYEQIKDNLNTELFEGEVAFDIDISDIKANQAYLCKGINVDIYLTIDKDKVLSDLLISNVRIIGLYDHNKQEIKDYDKDSLLQTICFAIPKDALPYLNKAVIVGKLSVIVGNNTYDNLDSLLNLDSEIFSYLN